MDNILDFIIDDGDTIVEEQTKEPEQKKEDTNTEIPNSDKIEEKESDELGVILNWFADKIELPADQRENLTEAIIEDYFAEYQEHVEQQAFANLPSYLQQPLTVAINEKLSKEDFLKLIDFSEGISQDVSEESSAIKYLSNYWKEVEQLDDNEIEEKIATYKDADKDIIAIAKKLQTKLGDNLVKRVEASEQSAMQAKTKQEKFIADYNTAITESGFNAEVSKTLTTALSGSFKKKVETIFDQHPKAAMQLVMALEFGFKDGEIDFNKIVDQLSSKSSAKVKENVKTLRDYAKQIQKQAQPNQKVTLNLDDFDYQI